MPKVRFALEPGGPKTLELTWSLFWRDLRVSFDGHEVGRVDEKKALEAGRSFTLPDQSTLHIRLKTGLNTELCVMRDGKPLPGSASDPRARVELAAKLFYVVAALNGVVGLWALVWPSETLTRLGVDGAGVLIEAAIYAVLGAFVWRQSRIALALGIALFVVDGVLGAIDGGNSGAIVARVFILLPMLRAWGAIRELNDERRRAQPATGEGA